MKWERFKNASRRSPLIAPALGLAAGIWWADGRLFWWPAVLLLVALIWALPEWRRMLAVLLFVALGSFSHGWRLSGQRELDGALRAGPDFRQGVVLELVEVAAFSALAESPEIPCRVRLRGNLPADLEAGDRLVGTGMLRRIDHAANPTRFDRRQWLWRRGVGAELGVWQARKIEGLYLPAVPRRWGERCADWLAQRLTRGLSAGDPGRAVILGVSLGRTGELDGQQLEQFRRSGALHVFAVSGMHVGIIGLLGWGLLRWCGLDRHRIVWLLMLLMLGYAWVTGFRASALRAAVMGVVLLSSLPLRRSSASMNRLAFAFIALLLIDGHQWFQPGFQLSFAVMLSILLLGPWLERRLPWRHPIDAYLPRPLWTERQVVWQRLVTALRGMLVVTVAAWCGSVILSLMHFQMLAPAGLLASLPMVAGAFLVLSLGFLSVMLGGVLPALVSLNAWIAGLMSGFALWLGGQSWAAFETKPDLPGKSAIALDVGEGAALVFGGQWTTLLDAGDAGAGSFELLPALDYYRTRPGHLLLSHGDGQHVGGALPLLQEGGAWSVARPRGPVRSPAVKALDSWLEGKRNAVWTPRSGDRLSVGDGTMRMLLSGRAAASADRADDWCGVWLWCCDGVKVLFWNDAGIARERELIKRFPKLQVEVIVLGKHFQDLSGTPAFLRKLGVKAVIASHRDYPPEQARSTDWRRRVESAGIRCLLLDGSGAVRIDCNEGSFRLSRWSDGAFRGPVEADSAGKSE